MSVLSVEELWRGEEVVLMDGATGTELHRRGFELSSPGWSAAAIREAPELLREIHQDYVSAGARVITTNTFRTHARNLKATEWVGQARQLTTEAIQIAREASGGKALVAGAIAPLEDCYSPQLTPSEAELETEHREMVRNVIDGGADFVLCETQITIRESSILARICHESQVPFLMSFTCGRDGKLLSGESLEAAVRSLKSFGPQAILVNCIPADEVHTALEIIQRTAPGMEFGAQANTGRLLSGGEWESTEGEYPAVYAEFALVWKEFGARWIGGCCGTRAGHVKALFEKLYGE